MNKFLIGIVAATALVFGGYFFYPDTGQVEAQKDNGAMNVANDQVKKLIEDKGLKVKKTFTEVKKNDDAGPGFGKRIAQVAVEVQEIGNPGTDKVKSLFPQIKKEFAAHNVEAMKLVVIFKKDATDAGNYAIRVSDIEGELKFENTLTLEGYTPQQIEAMKALNEKLMKENGKKVGDQ